MRTRPLPLLRIVRRVRGRPVPVLTELPARPEIVYAVPLTAAPSRPWRGAFVRPPARMTTARYTPHAVSLDGASVIVRTTPAGLPAWLRRIDRWIEYANSVVEE
jgi:hypothetical protein